jgi:hypothetical protein
MRTRASSGSLFSSASQVDCLTHVASCRLKCGSHLCLSSSKHNTSAGIAFCSYSRALTNLIVSLRAVSGEPFPARAASSRSRDREAAEW